MQILYGFLLAVVIAYLAYRARSLDKSGAFAAIFVGTIVFGLGGLAWAILLLIFFITSSGLSRAFKKRKQGLSEKFSKGSERDAGQVFGNGGVATIFVLVHALYPESLIRTRCPQSHSAKHGHRFEKTRRKRDVGWGFVIWNVRLTVGCSGDCLARNTID
jgi:uncharacterized membrane protein